MTSKPELKKQKEIGDTTIFDFFSYADLLSIQEHFYEATGLPSIIFSLKGEVLVEPSNPDPIPRPLRHASLKKGIPTLTHRYFDEPGVAIIPCTNAGFFQAVAPIGPEGEVLAIWAIGPACCLSGPSTNSNKEINLNNQKEAPLIPKEQFKKIALLQKDIAKQLCSQANQKQEFEILKKEIKEYTHKLSESAEKYRFLIENQNDIVIKFDTNEQFTYISPGFCRVFGKTEEQLLRQPIFSIVHPDDIDSTRQMLKKLKDPPHNCKIIHRAYTLSGLRWISWSTRAVLSSSGIVDSIICVGRDITKRREAEQKLEDSEKRYRNLIENSIMAIFEINLYGEFSFVNSAMRNLFSIQDNIPIHEISFRSLFRENPKIHFLFDEIKSKGKIENFETEVSTFEGTKKTILLNAILIDHLVQGTAIDISEKKKSEAEMIRINKELMIANTEKDKFFSIIAHDLRNPFNTFLGLTELMADKSTEIPISQLQTLAITMKKTARNVNNLLENLLIWSRSQQGSIGFYPQTIKVSEMIARFGESCMETAKTKGVELNVDFPPNLFVYADIEMLHLILRNLVSNAIKFSYEGGTVNIKAFVDSGNKVVFEIQDFGIGMNEYTIQNLFKPDVKTNKTGTSGEPSSGLGLLLCKEFIDKHQGQIWVKSQPGLRSTFTFTLGSTKS